jgi:hypothetical protein
VVNQCDPQVLRALRAELHQHRGVQADDGKLGTVSASTIQNALSGLRRFP